MRTREELLTALEEARERGEDYTPIFQELIDRTWNGEFCEEAKSPQDDPDFLELKKSCRRGYAEEEA